MLISNEIRGVLEHAGEIKTSAKGEQYQEVLIRVKAVTDAAGIAKGEDQIYPIMIFKKDKIEEVWQSCREMSIGSPCLAQVWLNSTSRVHEGKTYYNLQLKLKKLTAL